jgi:hypothetical protein
MTLAATTVDGDPNAVDVRAIDPAAPFSGTITAYGHDRTWTGTFERSVSVNHYDAREWSVRIRADGPIEGVAYTPSWASCTLHAGTRARSGYDARDVERPLVTLATSQPVEPASCPKPYRSPAVTRAFEPQTPSSFVHGIVRIGVALDERGVPGAVRIIASPDTALNESSIQSVRRSTFAPAVFRCKPVASGYVFAVSYG